MFITLPRPRMSARGASLTSAALLCLSALCAPPEAAAQTGRAQITVFEYDGPACRQEVARSGRDRSRPWYCMRGLASHPAGVAHVTVGGAPAILRPDSTGATQFVGILEMNADGADIPLVVQAANGELSEGGYRVTPAPPNPAYPELAVFTLTNLRPRVLGAGDSPPPPMRMAAAPTPSSPPAPAASSTPAAGAAPATATDPAGGVAAAAPAPVTEDPTSQFIQILEPREWSGVGTRGITVPGRRSVRVIGNAYHPGGVTGVEVDGRPAAIRAESGGSYRFVGYVPADSAAREVVVTVRGRTGNPVIGRYQLNATPAAQTFASREEAWSPATGFRGKRWAVVVGISAYQDTALRALQFADDDARAIYSFLRSPRAGGGGFAEENVKLLLNEQATFPEVRAAMYGFLRQATDEDQVFIYFAGHGAPDPARPNDLYLLTYDTRANSIPATAFPMTDMDRAIGELYAKHVVLVTDACHSGGITGQIASRGEQNNINDVFLAQLSSSTGGLAVFSASGADQVSLEDAQWGGGHGVFTHFLLQALEGAADEDGDQIVTLVEMMHWTMTQVRRATQNSQVPTIGNRTYDQYLPMSLVLNPGEVEALASAPPATPAVAGTTGTAAAQAGRAAAPGAVPAALADSLKRAREAVELFPGSAAYRSRLARVLLSADMTEEALRVLHEAVRLDPQNGETHAELGVALLRSGDAAGSLASLETAIRLAPQTAAYQHEYAGALLHLERVDDALAAGRRAVRLDAGNAAYHASLGDALRISGRSREAVASLRTAVELDGVNPVYRRDLARALAADGKRSEAITEMRTAVERDTANTSYHVELAGLYRAEGSTAEARAALARAVRLDSANAEVRGALGELLEAAGMQYEAILELRAAVKLDSANARYRYQHGMLLSRSNQAANALAELRAAVRLDPEFAAYRNALGLTLQKAGNPAEALTELIQATRLEPQNARFAYDLAMLYTEAGQHADAVASLEQAAQLEPGNREYTTALRDARRRVPR